MTREIQKKEERFYAEQAARSLGKTWVLNDVREHPDFVVIEDGQQFGLEVTELFIGPQGAAGSAMKANEARGQRVLDDLRRKYESHPNSAPLSVRFVGNMEPDNLATVIPRLLEEDLASKPVGHHFVHDTTLKHPFRNRLRVHVTRSTRPRWFNVLDQVGFVDRVPHGIITSAIAKKATELARYTQAAGDDIRLLLVANQINNSGKLALNDRAEFNFRGFSGVYLFPYPEDVIVLDSTASRASPGQQ
jgi:hypothetical protein